MKKVALVVTTAILALTPVGWAIIGMAFSHSFLGGLLLLAVLYMTVIFMIDAVLTNKAQSARIICQSCGTRNVTRSLGVHTGSRGGRYQKLYCSHCGTSSRQYS